MKLYKIMLLVCAAAAGAALPARGGLVVEPVGFSQTVMAGMNLSEDELRLTNASAGGTVYYGAAVTAGGGWLGLGAPA